MKVNKLIFIIFGLGVLLLSGCDLLPAGARTGSQAGNNQATPTPVPTPIVPTKPTYVVERGDIADILEFTGRMVPSIEQELFFRVSGRVRNVYVRRNETIEEGEILADLEIDDLERQLEAAQFDLESAQNQLAAAEAELANQVRRAEIQLEITKLRLAAAEAEADELTRAEINLEIAQIRLAKLEAQAREAATVDAKEDSFRLIKAEADLAQSETELRRAQDAYDAIAWGGDAGRSPQARALEQATVNYTKAKADYDLLVQQINQSSVDELAYDIALQERQVALAQIEVAGQEEGGVNYNAEILRQQVDLAELDLLELEDNIDPRFKDNIQSIELRIQDLEARIKDATLLAPFSGQILSFSLTDGESVQAFDPVAIVADPSELEVRADLTDSQMQNLQEGMTVMVQPSSRSGEPVEGTIRLLPFPYGGTREVAENTEDDGSTRITLSQDVTGQSGYGMSDLLNVSVVLEEIEDVLWLPPQAIRTFSGRNFVVIQDGEVQRRVDIEIGIQSEDRVQIEEGLEEGQIAVGN